MAEEQNERVDERRVWCALRGAVRRNLVGGEARRGDGEESLTRGAQESERKTTGEERRDRKEEGGDARRKEKKQKGRGRKAERRTEKERRRTEPVSGGPVDTR